MTQEDIQKSVTAAFHSVDLIEELKSKESLSEEEQDTLGRNKEHLKIMLEKDWFSEALTAQQKSTFQQHSE